MGFINIFVSNACKISINNNQLMLKGEQERHYAMQDINSIMIESRECTITTYTLSALAKQNIVIYVCDDKHMPSAIMTSHNTYCRQLEMLNIQQSVSKPTIKKLWQNIIKQKIINEVNCLDLLNIEGGELLEKIADNIYSGDTSNGEAHAAQLYFRLLFGDEFSRGQDTIVNAALNYCYAIVRGLIARSLVTYGLLPCLGLHHRSMLNNYNLADDIIEPFRAICDYYVIYVLEGEEELNTRVKSKLYSIVNVDVLINGESHSLSNAVDKMIISLKECMINNDTSIDMPTLIGANIHKYE